MDFEAAAAGSVTPAALADRIEAGERVHVLDTRNRDELDAWRIEGPGVEVTHVPYMEFVSARASGDPASLVDPDRSYVVVCPEGAASAEVAAMLAEAGVDAANLDGGLAAWARVYRRDPIAEDATDATVLQYRRPATGCLAYVVASAGEALVVDPLRAFVDRYAADVDDRGATLESVLDTHVHADHLSGRRDLARSTGATALVSEGAVERGVPGPGDAVADGDTVAVGDEAVEVLATPGHTTGAVSLRVDDLLLSGDSLFPDGAPRPDLEHGDDAAALARTLHGTLTGRLAALPDRTVVAPGHVPPDRPGDDGTHTARLGDLRDRLAVFSTDRQAFVDHVAESTGDPPANYRTIVAVNLGEESVDEGTAFELELGPNNCAVGD